MATEGGSAGRIERVRRRAVEVADEARDRAEEARRRWTAVDAAYDAREHDRQVVGPVLAGAIAFRLFVYLLPLFLAVVTVLGVLVGLKADTPDDLGSQLGLSGYMVDSVSTASEQSHRSLWILVPLTLWAVYSGGLGTAKVLHAVHALAWQQPREKLQRGWLASAVTFGAALGMGTVVYGLQALRHRSDGLGLGFAAVEVVALVVGWVGVSWLLPHDPAASWRHLIPGAVLVGVGFWVLHVVSTYFLAQRIANASELYGSLGTAAAILAWLYILGRLMAGSAIVNAALWHRQPPSGGDAGQVGGAQAGPHVHD